MSGGAAGAEATAADAHARDWIARDEMARSDTWQSGGTPDGDHTVLAGATTGDARARDEMARAGAGDAAADECRGSGETAASSGPGHACAK